MTRYTLAPHQVRTMAAVDPYLHGFAAVHRRLRAAEPPVKPQCLWLHPMCRTTDGGICVDCLVRQPEKGTEAA